MKESIGLLMWKLSAVVMVAEVIGLKEERGCGVSNSETIGVLNG